MDEEVRIDEAVIDMSPLGVQEGGDHYKNMPIQPIEYTMKNGLGFCEGNVIKYVSRHKSKNGLEDLLKAKHYIDLIIEFEYKGVEFG